MTSESLPKYQSGGRLCSWGLEAKSDRLRSITRWRAHRCRLLFSWGSSICRFQAREINPGECGELTLVFDSDISRDIANDRRAVAIDKQNYCAKFGNVNLYTLIIQMMVSEYEELFWNFMNLEIRTAFTFMKFNRGCPTLYAPKTNAPPRWNKAGPWEWPLYSLVMQPCWFWAFWSQVRDRQESLVDGA
jgi:hypothetical protein